VADIVDSKTRSRMMSAIRGKNTQPELTVRKGLHARGFRFRLHDPRLPGRPDIVLPKHKVIVLVHGCFWHGHSCRFFKKPASNRKFWLDKIEGNRRRDARNSRRLKSAGWKVITVWECTFRGKTDKQRQAGLDRLAKRIRQVSETPAAFGKR